MNKPPFDPNQPFDAVKPAFDPNAPFTAGDQSQPVDMNAGLNRVANISRNAQNAVLGPLGRASDMAARGFSNYAFGSEAPAEYAQKAVGLVGQGIQKLGEGVSGALGYATQRLANATGSQVPPAAHYASALAGTAISQIPGLLLTPGVGKSAMAEEAAQDLGRRSLGFTKGMLNKMQGGIEEANQTAQTMLDQGVIKPFSGARATLARAEELNAISGKSVGDALASTGQHALDTNEVAKKVIDQLAPNLQGGAYDADEKIANEIVDTIGAHGNGPIDFDSAQKLKNKLKQVSGANWNTDNVKASMYQKAYGIVSDELEKNVADAQATGALPVLKGAKTGSPHALFDYNDPITGKSSYQIFGEPSQHGYGTTPNVPYETLQQKGIPVVGKTQKAATLGHTPLDSIPSNVSDSYLANKQLYGASTQAIKALDDKARGEASNSLLSLRGAAIGAGALASGHIAPALESLGAWEAARRVGTGTGAYALNALNGPLAQGARRAAYASFITKITTKGNQ